MDSCLFQKVITRNETQIASSKIWTWVTDSISYDDNRDAKHAFTEMSNVISVKQSWDLVPFG